MAKLFMDKINTEYKSGRYIITATSEPYKGFRMFEKIRFSDIYGLPFHYFSIIENNKVIMKDYESKNHLKPDNIDYVDVYVSKYNKTKPLIVGVSNAGNYICYKWTDLLQNKKHNIFNLIDNFVPEFKLSKYLIDANDEINKKITFRIDKTENYNNIKVTDKVTEREFLMYTHEPIGSEFQNNKSCILIKNVLFNPKASKDLKNKKWNYREDTKIKNICVYRRSKEGNPLLVKLAESASNYYYFYRRNKNRWIQIDLEEKLQDIDYELEKIEFRINYTMNVFLNEKSPYTNDLVKNDIGSKNIVPNINVTPKKDEQNIGDYVFFVHDLQECSNFVSQAKNPFGKIIVLRFLISYNEIEISGIEYILYGQPILYVYFYKDDHVPLLFSYNNKYYGPESRERYFDTWVEIPGIVSKSQNVKLKDKLDEINKMLNEINIDKFSDYGLDYKDELNDYDYEHFCFKKDCQIRCKENTNSKLNLSNYTRIEVECEKDEYFTKYTHKTKNKFYIERLTYKSNQILDDLFFVDKSIDASVSVYYFDFKSENKMSYPLLLEFNTKNGLNYKYIPIKYKTDDRNEKLKFERIKDLGIDKNHFLEHQNFFLNNVACFSIGKKDNYSCFYNKDTYCQNKLVKVTEVKIGEHQKLITANYITYGHCAIDVEVEKSKLKKSNTKETSDVRKSRLDITAKNLKIGRTIVRLTHTTDPEKDPLFKENDVYVHFYGKDPRPLLVYCNDSAFAPKGVKEYKNNWILVEDVDYSNRGDGNYRLESVLDKLHEISYKLNPVDISQLNCYGIDTHFWGNIRIHVRNEKFGIYKLYMHTASEGHKLGKLTYKDQYIVDPSYPNKYHEIKEVIVYYYIFDEKNEYPLLIQLLFENHSHNLYYLLSSLDQLEWTRKYRIYLKLHKKENYEEAIFKILSQLLDNPEFTSLKNDIFSKFDTTEEKELQKHKVTYSSSGETTVEPKASKLVDGVNSPTSDSVKTVNRDKKCRGVTRGDSIARCDSISTRDSSDNTYLYKYLASIEEGETATTKPERRTVRSAEAYLPNDPGTEIKVLKTVTTDVDSENKLLMYIIGASVGSLFGVAALIFLLYKLFKRYLRDMRPLV